MLKVAYVTSSPCDRSFFLLFFTSEFHRRLALSLPITGPVLHVQANPSLQVLSSPLLVFYLEGE